MWNNVQSKMIPTLRFLNHNRLPLSYIGFSTRVAKSKRLSVEDDFKRRAMALLDRERKDEHEVHKILHSKMAVAENVPRVYLGNVAESVTISDVVDLCDRTVGFQGTVVQMMELKRVGRHSDKLFKIFLRTEDAQRVIVEKLNDTVWKNKQIAARTTLADYSQLRLNNVCHDIPAIEIKELCRTLLGDSRLFVRVYRVKNDLGEDLRDCIVRFASPEIRNKALPLLNNRRWKDYTLSADLFVPHFLE